MDGTAVCHYEEVPARRFRGDAAESQDMRGDDARIVELDGLRGLAAVAIVFFHCGTQRLPGGWAAVDLFFVLSGYLITSIILKYGESPGFLKTFYLRRMLRIWPIYYLTVLAVTSVRMFVPQRNRWAGLPYTLTYTQCIERHVCFELPDFCPYLWHTWSLAVEEQFYLIWPVLILAVGRRRVVPAALGCVALAALGRAGGWNWNILGARCDALALGGLLAPILARRPGSNERVRALGVAFTSIVLAGLACLVVMASTVGINLPAGPPPWPALTLLLVNGVWFGFVGLVVLHAGSRVLGALRWRVLTYLGRISYGLYLYHFVVLRIAQEIVQGFGYRPDVPWVKAPAVALSFVVADLSWKYIERPILSRMDHFPYSGGNSVQKSVPSPVRLTVDAAPARGRPFFRGASSR